jgi:hypothetical protein
MRVYVYVCMLMCMYARLCVCMHVYVYVCMFMCVCIFMCVYMGEIMHV